LKTRQTPNAALPPVSPAKDNELQPTGQSLTFSYLSCCIFYIKAQAQQSH